MENQNTRRFDLNIQKVLEDWNVSDALREIIANAIDEELLTSSDSVRIFEDSKGWHIRDFGRGLEYKHLTQNENQEKLKRRDLVIGKFGVGLKDALATFHRNKVQLSVLSRHCDVSLGESTKEGFGDIRTLHAFISDSSNPTLKGTDFVFTGLTTEQLNSAKDFFLRFSDEEPLEATKYGHVLTRRKQGARIYINGVRVAQEDDFLFSYNITSLTKPMEKALNRERTHIGRAAYSQRVRDILLECRKPSVATVIAKDLRNFETGKLHDELNWQDIAVHACRILNASGKYIFLTPVESRMTPMMVDHAEGDGCKVVTIPENVRQKLRGLKDLNDVPIRDLSEYSRQWNTSFKFVFVEPSELTKNERRVYEKTSDILGLLGARPLMVKKILISETMRMEGFEEAVGVWEPDQQRIVIKRSQLRSLKDYAGTLLHEVAHATSGAPDVSLRFESELTRSLGKVTSTSLGGRE
jgi:hypothetical protein